MDIPTLADTRSFQHIYHYSLSNLPESDFRPRLADDRVGHFTTLYQDYTSVLKDDPYVRYVERWHLEKAEPKFDQSPPKKPMCFWLENTIPPEYRDAVQEGILVWNKAFEPLGFEGAIVAKQQPDDAEWDAADVRYSAVRWISRRRVETRTPMAWGGRLRVEQSLRVDLVAERRERTTAGAGHELKLRSTLYW